MSAVDSYQVIVVGGGHAGTEAALAAARMGTRTLLLTHGIDALGQMSCNPAIGGIGKGHLVREIDALGGAMALAADRAAIHVRILNRRKGPAVQATRVQADRSRYKAAIRDLIEAQPNLQLFQQGVADLVVEGDRVAGVVTQTGLVFRAPRVVLTVGTFLGGRLHIGASTQEGGRAGDPPANALARRLRERGFQVARLKTGTPPRIDGRSVDFAALDRQLGDSPAPYFSLWSRGGEHPRQVPCHITHTNTATHAIIREALPESPIFSGEIEAAGPRYCPSIEDKVVRFADRDAHQIFLEPEGLDTSEVYPNGISTSLPFAAQQALVRSVRGLERAHLTRPGYAIEYDFFDPRGLRPTLETRHVPGLYFAGQINGTTGYEEAAAQGLLAGMNAAAAARDQQPWTPGRDRAYLGVLVDDLVTQGAREPYRMFTSRAEYRLRLREDNADLRLAEIAHAYGLLDDRRYAEVARHREAVVRETARLESTWVSPREAAAAGLAAPGRSPAGEQRLIDLLRRPEVDYTALTALPTMGTGLEEPRSRRQVEIEAKYAGYLDRQRAQVAEASRYEAIALPDDIDYRRVAGLSAEARERLLAHRPATIGQARRLSGMTPAAVSLLLVHLKKEGALPRSA